MKEIASAPEFSDNKELIINTKNVVETNYIVVSSQLTKHVYLLLKLRNVFWVVPKDDALAGKFLPLTSTRTRARCVPLGLATRRYANLTVRTLPNYKVSMQEVRWSAMRRMVRV